MTSETKYPHGHHDSVLRSHRWRTATNSAAYLLPHLQPHCRILDIGCGPGNITCDLASRVPQGSVIGIDPAESVVAEATATAQQIGVSNVKFATGDAYKLAFEDGEFDITHAHQTLQHLGDPVAALKEMKRVTKKGSGIIAARDASHFLLWPNHAGIEEWQALYFRVAESLGTTPYVGCQFGKYARLAGFQADEVSVGAGTWCFTGADLQWWSNMWADRVIKSEFHDNAIRLGYATEEDLERISQAWRDFGTTQDAWFTVVHGELLLRPQ